MSDSFQKNTITLNDIFSMIIKKWYLSLFVCTLSVIISLVITFFFTTPVYSSSAKLYIKDKSSNILNSSEISVSSYLTKDYEEIVVDRSILEEVIDNLSLETTYPALRGSISTNNPENTRFLEITVSATTPKLAQDIVNCICTVTQQRIVDVIDIDRVIIFSEGNLPTSPSSPMVFSNILVGLFVGLVLSVTIVLILFFRDDKINSEEDVEKHLEITVLGSVPFINAKRNSKKR